MVDFVDALIGTLTTPPSGDEAALKVAVRANVPTATTSEAKSQTGDAVQTVGKVREQVLAGLAPVSVETVSARTLGPDDHNKVIALSDGTGVLVTLPNDLPVGFGCTLVQWGVGTVTLQVAAGGAMRQEDGYTKSNKRYASIALAVMTNAGTTAEYLIIGSMKA